MKMKRWQQRKLMKVDDDPKVSYELEPEVLSWNDVKHLFKDSDDILFSSLTLQTVNAESEFHYCFHFGLTNTVF